MKLKAITVGLDSEQVEAIGPALDLIKSKAESGEPGMMLAQVFGSTMKVFVLDFERAKALQALLGMPVGATTRSLST